MASEGGRLAELRARVDDASADVARLHARAEGLVGRVAERGDEVARLEDSLARASARADEHGFLEVAKDTAGRIMSAGPILPMVLVVACVVGGVIYSAVMDDSDEPYLFTGWGSAVRSDRASVHPGARCEVRVAEGSDQGRCLGTVTCEGQVVFDETVACRMDPRERETGEGGTQTYYVLVARGVGHPDRIDLDEGTARLSLWEEGTAHTVIVLHEREHEGGL